MKDENLKETETENEEVKQTYQKNRLENEDETVKDEETSEENENSKTTFNEDYLELSQRIQAEFDNYRKRTQKIAEKYHEEGRLEVIKSLFPIMDSFNSAKKGCKPEQLVGIKEVEEQFYKVLESLNVTKIEAYGKPFNPNLHEAIMTDNTTSNVEEGIITEVLQEGYKMGDRVIRYSMVKVKG